MPPWSFSLRLFLELVNLVQLWFAILVLPISSLKLNMVLEQNFVILGLLFVGLSGDVWTLFLAGSDFG